MILTRRVSPALVISAEEATICSIYICVYRDRTFHLYEMLNCVMYLHQLALAPSTNTRKKANPASVPKPGLSVGTVPGLFRFYCRCFEWKGHIKIGGFLRFKFSIPNDCKYIALFKKWPWGINHNTFVFHHF